MFNPLRFVTRPVAGDNWNKFFMKDGAKQSSSFLFARCKALIYYSNFNSVSSPCMHAVLSNRYHLFIVVVESSINTKPKDEIYGWAIEF